MIRLMRLLTLVFACLFLVLSTSETKASTMTMEIEPVALTPESATAFVDGYVAANMAEMAVPGAAIVVVQNGVVIHAGGYGLANIEHNTPVAVDETIFRVGSVIQRSNQPSGTRPAQLSKIWTTSAP